MSNAPVLYRTDESAPIPGQMPDILDIVYAHWRHSQIDGAIPSWTAFDFSSLHDDILPWCAMVEVKREPYDFIYRYFGSGRMDVQGADYTDKSIRETEPAVFRMKALPEYRSVADGGRPIYVITHWQVSETEDVRYDVLRLPLSDDGKSVDRIFSTTVSDYTFPELAAMFRPDPTNEMAGPSC